MKLLTLLLLLPLFGIGQYGNLGDNRKTVFATPGTDSLPVYDTIPCLIQYSDTAKIMELGWEYFKEDTAATRRYADTTKDKQFGWIGNWTRDTIWKEPHPNVYWMKGFEVIERIQYPRISFGWDIQFERIYLDEKRKPLHKNIVVWMSK